MEANPGAVEAHSEDMDDHPETMEVHPGAVDARLEQWRLSLEP